METADVRTAAKRSWRLDEIAIGVILIVIGLTLASGGVWLLWLGGSPYYLLAGVACLIAAGLYLKHHYRAGLAVYLAMFAATCLWAIAEVGVQPWQLLPRIVGPLVLAIALILHAMVRQRVRLGIMLAAFGVTAAALVISFISLTSLPALTGGTNISAIKAAIGTDWVAFGNQSADRYSAAAQITPQNVGALEVAWTYRTGDGARSSDTGVHVFEATPLKVGQLVYICTQHSLAIAVDADSGKERWRFDPSADSKDVGLMACRGLAYFEASKDRNAECARRVLLPTIDARLIALDALTGRRCQSFGKNGEISLLEGMGEAEKGFYYNTSPPSIINGVAVLGGFVLDGVKTKEPSGIIRGFDAMTGKLIWAWDAGAVEENPAIGKAYSRGSPNSWTVSSADPQLGLVYVPMGNATPDYVGMHRSALDDRYSSAIVALDARTGKRRWSFQTVHHDLWDYDIGSQPVLFEMPVPGGGTVPALAQPTKHGDIYILDRRTGRSLTGIVERPVTPGKIPGERYAPTQPAPVGFPTMTPPPLRETDMWGATPIDQMLCRIKFRSLDYVGKFTPPSTRGSLQYPGNFGVVDWGSVSIDRARHLMLVNSSYIPIALQLVPQDKVAADSSLDARHGNYAPQKGTPYAAKPTQFLSPLGLPCHAPPWGKMTAIDLKTRTIAWQKPLGSTRDHAPLGIAVPGVFSLGGSVATEGGVVFVAATLDRYIRAFDAENGRELWRARLPAGGQAGAMSYVSDSTGRQYVLIAAGGHELLDTPTGDYVIAYALPTKKRP